MKPLQWVLCVLVLFLSASITQAAQQTTFYDVQPGTSIKQLSIALKEAEFINCAFCFEMRLRLKRKPIQAGEYAIKPHYSARRLAKLFVEGQTAQYAITFLEGWRFEDVLHAVKSAPKLEITCNSATEVAKALGLADAHPEGWLYPETYHYTKGSTDIALYQRAHARMQKQLNAAWANKSVAYASPSDLLTMASIIEKETAVADEMPRIAGVFYRRLLRHMRLQADPTVIYGMGHRFNGNLTKQDLRADTPYNTYTRHGLPPGPIAIPSTRALQAAANPTAEDALYFVARGDGRHHFSNTLAEHNTAVAHYTKQSTL